MKLRKKLIALSALTLSLIMVVPVFADNPVGWQKNETGWWYGTNATGTTWYHDGWQWIDGNKDGISDCYYFASNGYIVTNGKTPDGYDVNADGQWTINGVVQTIGAAAAQATGTANTNRPSSKEILDYLYRGRTDTRYFGGRPGGTGGSGKSFRRKPAEDCPWKMAGNQAGCPDSGRADERRRCQCEV